MSNQPYIEARKYIHHLVNNTDHIGFGLALTKREGDIDLETLPASSVLSKTESLFDTMRLGFKQIGSGMLDCVYYSVLIPIGENV